MSEEQAEKLIIALSGLIAEFKKLNKKLDSVIEKEEGYFGKYDCGIRTFAHCDGDIGVGRYN